MKALLISNMYPSSEHPGYGVFVKNFADSMRQKGIDFDIVVISGKGKSALEKIKKYLIFIALSVYKLAFKKYDIIYVHYIAHSAIPLAITPWNRTKTIIFNAHGEDLLPSTTIEKFIFKITQKTIRKSSLIVVPSEYFKEIALTKFPDNEIFVSPSGGINLEIFKPHKNHNPRDTFTVGYVSRIDPGKGWETLLSAAKLLKTQNPETKFRVDIVGDGSQRQELHNQIIKLGITDNVRHLGALPQDKLPNFYNSLDLFIFPTTRAAESLGLVGIEALSCGVPAICSDIGGITSYLKHQVNGYLFSPGDAEALKKYIVIYLSLPEIDKCKMRIEAANSAKPYDKDSVAEKLFAKIAKTLRK